MKLLIWLCFIGIVDAFILSHSNFQEFDPNSKTVFGCENTNLTIACPSRKRIHIDDAVYGRIDSSVRNPCMRYYHNTNCKSNKSMTVAQSLCQGKQSCEIAVTNHIFNDDPCKNAEKYLKVRYTCTDTIYTCEYNALSIICPHGTKIYIKDAIYGRLGPSSEDKCHYQNLDRVCWSNQSISVTKKFCQGQQECNFLVNNANFQRDPCSNMYKYLRVQYICEGTHQSSIMPQTTASAQRPYTFPSSTNQETCIDYFGRCAAYGSVVCTSFRQWSYQNCAKFCKYCDAQRPSTLPPSTNQAQDLITTHLPSAAQETCIDYFGRCAAYGSIVCTSFRQWAYQNCAKFCKYCNEKPSHHQNKSTTKPCLDRVVNCAAYGVTACVAYQHWAEINCPKTCGICGSFSSTTTEINSSTLETSTLDPSTLPTSTITTTTTTKSSTTTTTKTTESPTRHSGSISASSSTFTTKQTPIIHPLSNLNVHVTGECKDHLSVCARYGNAMCITYAAWAVKQCPVFCKFCSPTTAPL